MPDAKDQKVLLNKDTSPEDIIKAASSLIKEGSSLAVDSWQYKDEFSAPRLAQPDCKSCGGTGVVGSGIMAPVCACTQLTSWRNTAEVRIEKIFGKQDRNMTLATYDTGGFDQNKLALTVACNFVENWLEAREKGWIIGFNGDVGTGKSHLATGIALALVKRFLIKPFHLNVPNMLRLEQESWRDDGQKHNKDGTVPKKSPIRLAADADLTILDDLGAEQRKGRDENQVTWAQETLYVILEERIRNARPTIYTTNLSLSELRSHFGSGTAGERLWGRIERAQVMPPIELVAVPSKRRRNMADMGTLKQPR